MLQCDLVQCDLTSFKNHPGTLPGHLLRTTLEVAAGQPEAPRRRSPRLMQAQLLTAALGDCCQLGALWEAIVWSHSLQKIALHSNPASLSVRRGVVSSSTLPLFHSMPMAHNCFFISGKQHSICADYNSTQKGTWYVIISSPLALGSSSNVMSLQSNVRLCSKLEPALQSSWYAKLGFS